MIYVGDLHGNWRNLIARIAREDIHDKNFMQVGDLGLGFQSIEKDLHNLEILNQVMEERNCMFYAIRGNHDNPDFFMDDLHYHLGYTPASNLEQLYNIKLVSDGTILDVENKNILCIGGGISIDRSHRAKGIDYWEEEEVNSLAAFKMLLDNNAPSVDVVVTHIAPTFTFPIKLNRLCHHYIQEETFNANWKNHDLKKELNTERKIMDDINDIVSDTAKDWYYGHYHQSNLEKIGTTNFRCLNIDEWYDDQKRLFDDNDVTII